MLLVGRRLVVSRGGDWRAGDGRAVEGAQKQQAVVEQRHLTLLACLPFCLSVSAASQTGPFG
jgi:hypothetical protein